MMNGEYYSKFDQSEKIFYCVAHSFSFLLFIFKFFLSNCVFVFCLHIVIKLKLCYVLQVVVGLC
jgi:hypothetical protein